MLPKGASFLSFQIYIINMDIKNRYCPKYRTKEFSKMPFIYNIDADLYDEIYFNKIREDSRLARYAINHFGFVVVSNKKMASNADIFADKGIVYVSRRFFMNNKRIFWKIEKASRTICVYIYANRLTLAPDKMEESIREGARILIDNGFLTGFNPLSIAKALKRINPNGLRLLLETLNIASNSVSKIHVLRCMGCKYLRCDNTGDIKCAHSAHPLTETEQTFAGSFTDLRSRNGVQVSKYLSLETALKGCSNRRSLFKNKYSSNAVYQLDNQLNLKRKIFNINIDL